MCSLWRYLKSTCILFIRLIICAIMVLNTPFLGLFYIPFYLYRQFIVKIAKWLKKDSLEKILSTRSALLCTRDLYDVPFFTLVPTTVVEGTVDVKVIREKFQKYAIELRDEKTGLLKYPELKQNICFWMGFPFFRNLKELKIEDHIKYYNNDENFSCNFTGMKRIGRELSFEPFSKDRALWQLIIIPHYTPNPGPSIVEGKKYSVVLFREHHALADAFSLFRLLQGLSSPEKFDFLKTRDYIGLEQNSWIQKCISIIRTLFKMPFDLSELVYLKMSNGIGTWENESAQKKALLKSRDYTVSPESYMNTIIADASQSFCHNNILKEVKSLHGVSGVSVIYAAVCGALRNTFFPQCQSGIRKFPKDFMMTFPLPLLGRNFKLRNTVTGGFLLLPIGESDSVKRLKLIHKRSEELKTSTIPMITAVSMAIMGSLPFNLGTIALKMLKHSPGIFLTNNAGPTKDYDYFGYPAVDMYASSGLAIRSSLLTVLFISEGGHAKIAVGGDAKIISTEDQASQFIQNFLLELEILKADCSFTLQDV